MPPSKLYSGRRYAAVSTDPLNLNKLKPGNFTVGYYNDQVINAKFWDVWQITLIVVLILVGPPG